MDRNQILDALSALGFDVSMVDDTTPDQVLAETLRCLQMVAAEPEGDEPPVAKNSDQASPDDSGDEKPDQMGDKKSVKVVPVKPAAMSDAAAPAAAPVAAVVPATTVTPATHTPASPADRTPASVTFKYSENGKIVTLTKDGLDKLIADGIAVRESQIKTREPVNAFCERMRIAGKLLPVHIDGDGKSPTIKDVLEAVAEIKTVSKFSEGAKKLSLAETLMKAIESGPVLVKFAETVRDPSTANGAMDPAKKARMLAMTPLGKQAAKALAAK